MVFWEKDSFSPAAEIKKQYRIGQIYGRKFSCAFLKVCFLFFWLKAYMAGRLTEKERKDGLCFLLFGEGEDNCHRFIRQYYLSKKRTCLRCAPGRTIYLIGTPNHYNIGDHIIAYATVLFLRQALPDAQIVEISMDEFPEMFFWLKKNAAKEDWMVLQGGGNMGNVYFRNERIRREVIKAFPEQKILIFPQSMYYEQSRLGHAQLEASKRIYAKASRLTICARERASYHMMKQSYPLNRVILVPDIVCWLRLKPFKRGKKALLLLRRDRERSVTAQEWLEIEKKLQEMNTEYVYSDMITRTRGYMGRANRERQAMDKIGEIGSAKFLITDRLHGMILAAITETPCLVIARYHHKIASFLRTWFSELLYIRMVQDIQKLPEEIQNVMESAPGKADSSIDSSAVLDEILKRFMPLIKIIEEDADE